MSWLEGVNLLLRFFYLRQSSRNCWTLSGYWGRRCWVRITKNQSFQFQNITSESFVSVRGAFMQAILWLKAVIFISRIATINCPSLKRNLIQEKMLSHDFLFWGLNPIFPHEGSILGNGQSYKIFSNICTFSFATNVVGINLQGGRTHIYKILSSSQCNKTYFWGNLKNIIFTQAETTRMGH